jgi:23S rRNA pseudouridine2605 synthase
VSLARAISKSGLASRTVAATWIAAGRVSVNDALVRDPDRRVDMSRDRIAVDGQSVAAVRKRYLVLNKPRGLVTTARDEQGRGTVYECLPDAQGQWLAPVGRLDKASEGLLLFTNDTQWARRILDPATHVAKVYHVQIGGLPDAALLEQLRAGVQLEDGVRTRQAGVAVLRHGAKNCWLEITLEEGKNRQIRRMLASVDRPVLRLVRVAIGRVLLGELPKGQSRELTVDEVSGLAGM